MNIFISILLLVLTAKIMSKVSKKFGFNSLLGEFAAGLVLGISFFHLITPQDVEPLANLGIVLLMFLVGYEGTKAHFFGRRNIKISIVSVAGLVITLFALFFFGIFFFKLKLAEALFFTFAFALTDEAISARTLISLGKLKTNIGNKLVNIALIDTIVGFLLLLISFAVLTASTFFEFEVTIGQMALFLLVILMSFRYLHKLFKLLRIENSRLQFLAAFFIIFIISYLANKFNLMAIGVIGAYFAGQIMQKSKDEKDIKICLSLKSVAYGIFIPIFFAWVGLSLNLNLMPKYFGKALLICGVALAVKFIAVALVSKFEKFSWKESWIYGIGTSARGHDSLIILLIATTTPALTASSELFASSLIILIVVSLIFSSIALKKLV